MKKLVLTDDEFLTFRKVIHDWGVKEEYHIADFDKVEKLKEQFVYFTELDKEVLMGEDD